MREQLLKLASDAFTRFALKKLSLAGKTDVASEVQKGNLHAGNALAEHLDYFPKTPSSNPTGLDPKEARQIVRRYLSTHYSVGSNRSAAEQKNTARFFAGSGSVLKKSTNATKYEAAATARRRASGGTFNAEFVRGTPANR